MIANEERGEFEVALEGVPYGMRPSWEAIQAFEVATGRSLLQLADDANRSAMSLAQCAIVVTECVKAWGIEAGTGAGRGFQPKNVAPLLIETAGGITLVQRQLALMLFMAATGGLDSKGEAKATPTETKVVDADASAGSPAPTSDGHPKRSGGRHR